MPVEVIGADDGVEKLNETWPDGSEPVKQGDDHLRNIKKAVKNQERVNAANNYGISNPNLLINGDFSVWQRGFPFLAVTGQYTADRWLIGSNGGNLNVRLGYGIGAGGQSNGLSFECSASVNPRLNQRVEANTFRSSPATHVTISFWAFSSVGNLSLDWVPRAPVAKDDWSSVVDLGTHSLGTLEGNKWKFFTKTIPVTQAFQMGFGGNVQVTGTITASVTFARFKLEFGEVPSLFIPDDLATTLAKCQRYFEEGIYWYGQYGTVNTNLLQTIPYKVTKRVTPVFNITGLTSTSSVSSMSVSSAHVWGVEIYPASSNSSVTYRRARVDWQAEAEL